MSDILNKTIISEDGKYRYVLFRNIQPFALKRKTVCFFMLNPSTADYHVDDPTLRRCINFGKTWGYNRLLLVNLFAMRSKDPRQLLTDQDPIGPENAAYVFRATTEADLVVAAWGNHKATAKAPQYLIGKESLFCLGHNTDQSPRHPLYVPKTASPIDFHYQHHNFPNLGPTFLYVPK